jgi:hypothetical protein
MSALGHLQIHAPRQTASFLDDLVGAHEKEADYAA